MAEVKLVPLEENDREQFILDNQRAFKYGATEEFGMLDDHFEEEGEIISRATIEHCIDAEDSEAYRIVCDGRKVGGMVLKINKETHHNELELLFTLPEEHSKGVGLAAWKEAEKLHPETEVWETITPYFEKRNLHFYVNKCGFSVVEFFNKYHVDKNFPVGEPGFEGEDGSDEMLRFEKRMK